VDAIVDEAMKRSGYDKKSKVGTPMPKSAFDDELESLLSNIKARIVVIGTGGAGNNTMSRLMEVGITGAHTVIPMPRTSFTPMPTRRSSSAGTSPGVLAQALSPR